MTDKLDNQQDIKTFVSRAQSRCNRRRLLRSLCWGAFVAAVGMAAIAGGFVAWGYKVQTGWPAIPLAAGALWAAVHYLLGRQGLDHAADKADRFFNLKEALVSAVGAALPLNAASMAFRT